MATSKEFNRFILDQLNFLGNVRSRPMMGEYLLYYNDQYFGGIYDEQLLVKNTKRYQGILPEIIPYKGAKAMLHLVDLEDKEKLREVIINTCEELKKGK